MPVARDSAAQHVVDNVVSPATSRGQPPPWEILPTEIDSTPSVLSRVPDAQIDSTSSPSVLSEVPDVLGGAAQPPSSNALAPAGPAAPSVVHASGYHALLRGY
jgi:hypothetical protein